MFVQVIEGITKIVTLFSNQQELVKAHKRKQIGKKFVELHQIISRLADNANSIEKTLKGITKYPMLSARWHILGLENLLMIQKSELLLLQELLRSSDRAMFEIYGDNVWRSLSELVGIKVSLIDIITQFVLIDPIKETIFLPNNVDLIEIFEFRKFMANDSLARRGDYQHLLLEENDVIENLSIKIDLNEEGGPAIYDKQKQYLLEQITKAKSSHCLIEINQELAKVIKSNFKIEDLF